MYPHIFYFLEGWENNTNWFLLTIDFGVSMLLNMYNLLFYDI
jgi:hypothetical protein